MPASVACERAPASRDRGESAITGALGLSSRPQLETGTNERGGRFGWQENPMNASRRLVRAAPAPASPDDRPSSLGPPSGAAPAARVPRPRVLAVDDESLLLKAFERILAPELEVVAVSSAREALRLVDSGEPFAAVLADLQMPDMDGQSLHEELARRDPALAVAGHMVCDSPATWFATRTDRELCQGCRRPG